MRNHLTQGNEVQCVLDDAVKKIVQNGLASSYANAAMGALIVNLDDICVRNDIIDLMENSEYDSTHTDHTMYSESEWLC